MVVGKTFTSVDNNVLEPGQSEMKSGSPEPIIGKSYFQ
jgi:hypothetical protein